MPNPRGTRIDIDGLSEEELTDLNHRVVERLKLMREMHTRKRMAEFKIGDRVAFNGHSGEPLSGLLIRANRKTVTVLMNDGHQWNVAPGLLTLVEEGAMVKEAAEMIKVIPFPPAPNGKRR
jgi:predicted Rossmann-fold nucleotide-binding protein